RPYAAKARERIIAGVDAGLRACASGCRKLDPRAANRIEAFAAWVRKSETRGLGTAGIAAALVLAAASALLRGHRAAAVPPRAACRPQPPLADATRRAVRDKADQLSRAIEERFVVNGRIEGDAWTSAQVLVALRESGYKSRASAKAIERHFRAMAGPECTCWR